MGLFSSKPKTDIKNTSPADNTGSNKKNKTKGKIKIPRTVQETRRSRNHEKLFRKS